MRRRTILTLIAVTLVALAGITGLSAGQNTAAAENPGPELTVYNQGMALVKDTRTLNLKEGVQTVTVTDVAAQIDPTSVFFKSLTDPAGTTVLEQNYEYDLVGTDKLLSKVRRAAHQSGDGGWHRVRRQAAQRRHRHHPAGRRRPGAGRQPGSGARFHLPHAA